MKTLKLSALVNIGPYSHITAEYEVEARDCETALTEIEKWKLKVAGILHGVPSAEVQQEQSQPVVEETTPPVVEEVKEEKPKKKRKPRTSKKVEDNGFNGQDIPPVIEAPKAIPYDRSIESHKNTLSAFLGNNFPGWKSAKPREEIIAFTASLEGKPFLNDAGEVIESFHEVLKGFFGA